MIQINTSFFYHTCMYLPAEDALRALDAKELLGKRLRVEFSRPLQRRDPPRYDDRDR